MNKFLEIQKLQQKTQEQIEILTRSITSKESESSNPKPLTQRSLSPDEMLVHSTKILKRI